MKIEKREIEKIARLSMIDIDDKEVEELTKQLSDIISFFEKINELDTENIEPTSHIQDITNVFREDVEKESLPVEKIMELAPKHQNGFIVVPKVI